MAATKEELVAVATVNGLYDRWGGNRGSVKDSDERVNLTAFDVNGHAMLHDKDITPTRALLVVERWKQRQDIADIKVEEAS